MKHKFLTLISALLIISCTDQDKQADAYGNFESNATSISAENAGKIIYLNLNEGDILKKGQLVAVVDSTLLHLQKKQIQAQFEGIDANSNSVLSQIGVLQEKLKVQKQNQQRLHELYKSNSATKKQVDDIDGEVAVTERQISSVRAQNSSVLSQRDALKAQSDLLAEQIKRCKIINPIDGVVLNKFVELNELTAPGKIIYRIQDDKTITLRSYIQQTQLTSIKINDLVSIEVDSEQGSLNYQGRVSFISDQAEFTPKIIQTKDERKNLVYAVKIEVKNDGKLKFGMPASVYFKSE